MSWGFGNSASLDSIASYADAKNKFIHTAPIRGRAKECRPLGKNRRYSQYEIAKNMRAIDDGIVGQWQETYSAKVYGSDILEWFPDGKLAIKVGRWHGTILQSVINYTTNRNVGFIESYNGKWYFNCKNGKSYFLPLEKEQSLIVDTASGMVDNPIQEHRRRVNRKAMNAVRKQYANFIEYGTNMLKISRDAFKQLDEQEAKAVLGTTHINFTWSRWSNASETEQNRNHFLNEVSKFEQSGDLTLAYTLASIVAKGIYYWGNAITPEQFKKYFYEVLKYKYKNEVFESEPVEIGTPFYDRNAKYFY
jgi:hypothetical protein